MKLKKFYVVWRNPADWRPNEIVEDRDVRAAVCNLPTVRHDTHEGALAEARRLAAQHAGSEFFVLVSTVRVCKDDIRVDTLK